MSRYRRARTPGATYFFTVNTYKRQRLLTDDEALTALREALRTVRSERPFRVDAMVILPDCLVTRSGRCRRTMRTMPLESACSSAGYLNV